MVKIGTEISILQYDVNSFTISRIKIKIKLLF